MAKHAAVDQAIWAQSRSAAPTHSSQLLMQRCACGGTPGVDGQCAGCRAKRMGVQRQLQALAGLSNSLAVDRYQAPVVLQRQPISRSAKPPVPSAHVLPLQAKLTVNEPGDVYEQEADRVADQVMRMLDPVQVHRTPDGTAKPPIGHTLARMHVQRCGATPCNCSPEEKAAHMGAEELQRAAGSMDTLAGSVGEGQAAPPIVHEVLRSSGQPLDAATRGFMEPRFGHDFSRVRVHADARAAESAQAVNALAYTIGSDTVFGAGQYAPGTTAGLKLIAHELTHTIQQRTDMSGVQQTLQAAHPDRGSSVREAKAGECNTVGRQLFLPKLTQSLSLARQDDGGADGSVAESDTTGPSDTSVMGDVSDASVPVDAGPSVTCGSVQCPAPADVGLTPTDPGIKSGSLCRGACGSNCPDTCTGDYDLGFCWPDSTGQCYSWCTYSVLKCGSHEGCRKHDDCYDRCADKGEMDLCYAGGSCHCGCDSDCITTYYPNNCISWMRGRGPYDSYLKFYTYKGQSTPVPGICDRKAAGQL